MIYKGEGGGGECGLAIEINFLVKSLLTNIIYELQCNYISIFNIKLYLCLF